MPLALSRSQLALVEADWAIRGELPHRLDWLSAAGKLVSISCTGTEAARFAPVFSPITTSATLMAPHACEFKNWAHSVMVELVPILWAGSTRAGAALSTLANRRRPVEPVSSSTWSMALQLLLPNVPPGLHTVTVT